MNKRLLGILTSISMVVSLCILSPKVEALSGDGTQNNPYIISSVEDLNAIDQKDNYIYAKLKNNIIMDSTNKSGSYGVKCFIKNFYGDLDGNGYSIIASTKDTSFINNFIGGKIHNLKFLVDGVDYFVLLQTIDYDHIYEDISIEGDVKYSASNANESPLLVYAQGNTTFNDVTLDFDLESNTYNGLFIGYEPCINSKYVFNNCTVKGNYVGDRLGVLFGNGSNYNDWGLDHVLADSSQIEISNLNLTDAKILGLSDVPHVVCGASYATKYDVLENKFAQSTIGYENMTKSENLENVSFSLNSDNYLKIEGTNSNISKYVVTSGLYSNTYTNGTYNGTMLHGISEEISTVDGVDTYYSSLGKVSFYDGNNGKYGTTGIDGKIRTITVDGKTYYTLSDDTQDSIYTFKKSNEHSNTAKQATVIRIYVYDKNDKLINIVSGPKNGSFEKPVLEKEEYEGTTLKNIKLTDGWTLLDENKKVILGGQIAFARQGNVIAPVFIYGKEIPAESVSLDKNKLLLKVGDEESLTATIKPSNTTTKDLKWTSSNSNVASVDENGNIRAISNGETTINVTTINGKNASCKVIVYKVEQPKKLPTIDTSEPVNEISAGVDISASEILKETTSTIVDKIIENSDVESIDNKTVKKIKDAVEKGKEISTAIEVELKEVKEISKKNQMKIENEISNNEQENKKESIVCQYINIEIALHVDGTKVGNITQLDEPIEFRIAVPKEFLKKGRKFYVVRLHNGKTTILDTTLNEDGTLSFKTDKFSTYAVVYVDTKESGKDPGKDPGNDSGKRPEKNPDNDSGKKPEKNPDNDSDKKPEKNPDNDSGKDLEKDSGENTGKEPKVEETIAKAPKVKSEVTKEENKKVKTGDESNAMLYVGLGLLAAVGCMVLFLQSKKKY